MKEYRLIVVKTVHNNGKHESKIRLICQFNTPYYTKQKISLFQSE